MSQPTVRLRHALCALLLPTLLAAGEAPADGKPGLRVPVSYASPGAGLVSLALYDQEGVLVRTLLAAAKSAAGERTVQWDGTDDLGRPVKPGTYSVRGVSFAEGPALKWVMKVGKSGNPPWSTADGTGNWGGNLGYPASITSNGSKAVLVWGCVEDHTITGVQQMDADGAIDLRYHTFYPWDSRSASAMDATNLYVGILNWGSGLEIAEYKVGQPRGRILTKLPSRLVPTPTGRWVGRDLNNVDGIAITAERIYASVAANHELFVIERATGAILEQVRVASPYGLAVSGGRLLVVSEDRVLTYSLAGEPTGVLVDKGALQAPNALCVAADGTLFVGDGGRIAIDSEWTGGTRQIHVFDAAGKPLRRIGKAGGAPRSGRFDSAGLGDITGICVAPGGTSLLVTDIATGFQRTSRWSLGGSLEKEWFCRKLECWSDQRNPDRPNELLKIGGPFDDLITFQAWEMDIPAKTWRPSWRHTMPYAQCWQEDVVLGYGHGGNPLKDAKGERPPWPIFGYQDGGLRTHRGRNYLITEEGAIWTYGSDQAPKLVGMAFSHRCEMQDGRIQTYYDRGPNTWFTWADRDGDQRVQLAETILTSGAAPLAESMRLGGMWFGDNLDIHYLRLVKPDPVTGKAVKLGILPLKELTADGVPVYDWSQARDQAGDPLLPDLHGGDGVKGIGATWVSQPLVESGGSRYGIVQPECTQPLKLPGIDGDGWWAGRNWRKKLARFDQRTGKCLWAVGRRAPGVAEPGQMYNPISVAGVAGGAVFVADAMGVIWAWDEQGLYLGRLYHGPDAKRMDSEALNNELQRANVFTHSDGRIYAATNDFGVSVHEVLLPTCRPVAGRAVRLDAAQVALARPWDPDGVTPTEKPRAEFHRVTTAVTIDGDLDGREGWHGSADGRIKAARPLLVLMDGERLATVRGMYDDANLYLFYEVRAPNGPLNAGSELPFSPFTSGAYVDASFAPDWSEPQRREPRDGDVRVLAAMVREGPGTVPFHRAFWQLKAGAKEPRTITSPAASVVMAEIAELPGLKQAWRVGETEKDTQRVRYQVEMSIPLAALGIAATPGRVLGFDCSVAVANASGDRRERAAHWGGLSEAAVVDRPGSVRLLPGNWGTVVLRP